MAIPLRRKADGITPIRRYQYAEKATLSRFSRNILTSMSYFSLKTRLKSRQRFVNSFLWKCSHFHQGSAVPVWGCIKIVIDVLERLKTDKKSNPHLPRLKDGDLC
jgi:hypothetical protein